ncbi:DUF4350 domain-containing protein [soil metagenome]
MTDLATSPGTAASAAGPAARGGWHRHRSTLLIAGFLVLAVVVLALTSGSPARSGTYDPDNPDPDGAQALARVLADQGVDLRVVRSADELDGSAVDEQTTVVVTSTDNLGRSTVDRLLARTRGSRVVVVDPSSALLDLLDVAEFTSSLDTGDPIAGDCQDPAFGDLEIDVDSGAALPLDGCFDDALATSGRLTLLGAGQLLSNGQVQRADNAAVALRLLGSSDRLVWYVASADDLVADDGVGIGSLLPDWIGPGLFLLLLASLGLVGWRGRRLGPLASEPLPVVVKAIETTRSRGRLYRRSGDQEHAAHALRAATRERAAARLRLGATDERTLIRDVARHVGRPEHEIGALLSSANTGPGSDRALITLANDLAALEEEVRRS